MTETVTYPCSRPLCTPEGCVATGLALDDKNQRIAAMPRSESEYHFIDNTWESAPRRTRQDRDKCSVVNNSYTAGAETVVFTGTLKPHSDGILRVCSQERLSQASAAYPA